MSNIKICAWNTSRRKSVEQIADSLVEHDPECAVVLGCTSRRGGEISNQLGASGWTHRMNSNPRGTQSGIFVACRSPIEIERVKVVTPCHPQRWLPIYLQEYRISLLAVHIPGINDQGLNKIRFWDDVLEYASAQLNSNAIIIGSFNTGFSLDCGGTPFEAVDKFQRLIELGWTDAWRTHNSDVKMYSWFSHEKNGFRLDHAFLSPPLRDRLLVAYYSHRERIEELSDHSMLFIELSR